MTTFDLANEIYKLPNYIYAFIGNDKKEHFVVLGGQSCLEQDLPFEVASVCLNYLAKALEIFNKSNHSKEEKQEIALLAHKIQIRCDCRKSSNYSKEQQESYLAHLDPDNLKEIEQQVELYKLACHYYAELHIGK